MNKLFLFVIVAILCVFAVKLYGQNHQIDSLKFLLKDAKHDTVKSSILLKLGKAFQTDTNGFNYFNQALKISENALKNESLPKDLFRFYKLSSIKSLNEIGKFYFYRNEGNKAISFYLKSKSIGEEIRDKKSIAMSLNNIAHVYKTQGDMSKAIDYYMQSLKIKEEIGDAKGVSYSLNGMASIFITQGDLSKALEYYTKSLNIREKINDESGIAECYSNIGLIYNERGDPHNAMVYYKKSLKIMEKINMKGPIATLKVNIGNCFLDEGDFKKAIIFYKESLKLSEEINFKNCESYALISLAHLYNKIKDYKQALFYCNRSMEVSKEIGYPENIRNSAIKLSDIYKAIGNHKLALLNYELYIKMNDSINNESTRKASIKSQLKYEYEKQAAADSVAHVKESEIKNAEIAKQTAEIKAKKNQQYALFGGLGLVMVFAGFMYNRFKVTQKQKGIIEEQKLLVESQKHLVEEKQNEMLDSIRYAKRIQLAQIPSEKRVFNMLKKLKKN